MAHYIKNYVELKPLNINARVVTSMLGKALGFMFHFPGNSGKIFEFSKEKRITIHMLFVFFPLIVVWLDNKKQIEHFTVMRPFTSFSGHSAKYVLEVPYSAEVLKRLKLGQALSW